MSILYAMDLFGTAIFAVSGGLMAARKRYDIFGFLVVAMCPALGGGTLRDMTLGATPVFWIEDVNYLWIAMTTAILTFFYAKRIREYMTALLIADAVGLALFAIVGAQKAMNYNVLPEISVVMGVMTACVGGMIRDVLCREEPLILRKDIYATAAIFGAGIFVLLEYYGQSHEFAMLAGFISALALRLIAIRQKLSLPIYSEDE